MEAFGSSAESHLRKSPTDFSVSMETTEVVKSRADVDLELTPAVISFAQFSKLQSSSGFSKTLAQCVGFSNCGGAKAIGVNNSIPSTETLIECQKQGSPSRKEEFHGSLFPQNSPVSRSTPSLEQEPPKFDIENSSRFGENWNRETGNVSLGESKHDQSELLFSSPESSKEESKGNVQMIKEEDQFSVGDFVWSKIKNNLWWPGKIYSSSDASNYALKYKQEDHHLVAYFGDGSFSWCPPSQLEHFEDHFEPMSKQSNSKGFVSAVQMALVEVGTRLEMDLSCSCLPFSMNSHPHPTLNAGIKQGTCLDVRRTGKLSVLQYEPSDLLNILKFLAHNSFSDNMFDLTVLRSWLAALYKAKGGHRLPIYSDPLPVLDQLITDRNTLLEVFDFTEISHEDVVKENVFTPVGLMNNQAHEFPSIHIHKILDEQLSQRKQKSMVEILGEQGGDVELEHNHGSESGGDSQGSGPELIPRSRKRSNSSGRLPIRSTAQSKSGRRRRKVGPSVVPRYELLEIESGSSGSEDESTAGIAKDKMSYFTSEIQDDDSIQGPRKSTMRQNMAKKKSTSIKGKKKEAVISDMRVKMEDVTQEHEDSMGLESCRKVYLTRERKKSKYLSPPYTTEMDEEDTVSRSPMEPKLSPVRDGVSPPVLIWGGQDVYPHEEHSSGDDKTGIQNRSLTVGEFDLNETRLSSDEALSELQSAAVDLRYSGHQAAFDAVKKFFFMFRCSVYSTHEDGKLLELGFEPESISPLPLSDDQFHRPSTPQPSPGAEQNMVDVESVTQYQHHSPMPDVMEERDQPQMDQMEVEPATGDPFSIRHPEMEFKPVAEDGITQQGEDELPQSTTEHTHEVTKPESTAEGEDELPQSTTEHTHGVTRPESRAEEIFTPYPVAEKVGDGGGQKKKRGRPRRTDGSKQQQQKQQQPGSRRGRRKEASSRSVIYISFPPAMSLPCKEELVQMYDKFGAVVDMETDVSHNSYGARVAFEKAEDAERAFNSCREKSPFGEAKVSFQLQHQEGLVQKGNGEEEKREWWDAGLIRQKLVLMTSMLEGSDVMPPRDITLSLEAEMEGLLDMLRVMIRSFSSSP